MTLHQYGQDVIALVREHAAWAPAIMFTVAFVESLAVVSLLVPAWGALIAIGALVGTGTIGFWPVWVAGATGAALGDWLSYWIGIKLGPPVAHIWPLSRRPDLIPRGEVFVKRWGVFAIVIGRFFGPLRAVVPLAAGIFEMPYWRFQAANVASAFLWAWALLSAGESAIKLIDRF
jgi:membrane protein DedA with SNARE-associated domain